MAKAVDGGVGRLVGILIGAALLAGCGGTSSNVSSGASTASSSSSSSSSTSTSTATTLIALSSADYTATPSSSAVVTINRAGGATGSATVAYSTVNGTATAGVDYVATSGSVTWQDGDSSPKTVSVPVTSKAGGKSFSFSLTSVEGQADFGSPASATVTVANLPADTDDTVTLSWTAPTQNTNGTALTNLAGYDIHYGTSPTAMTQEISIKGVGNQTYVISDLTEGTWYFEILSVNSSGVESNPSGIVSTTIG
jgi:hypothetical protein